MILDADACYRALLARDRRFDGRFFVAVESTGIYCRPICPARTPRRDRCRFFSHAAAAEAAGFRPCLRCRPELAPGRAPVDAKRTQVERIIERIEHGAIDDGRGLEALASQVGLSARQVRRLVREAVGVSPVQLVQTRRLLLAKQLLTDTRLPVIDVAFASGFSSVRRFNAAFAKHYRMSPTDLRRRAATNGHDAAPGIRLKLSYRPPLDWDAMLDFLGPRAIAGVERIIDGAYMRTVALGEHRGWVRVRHDDAAASLRVELAPTLVPVVAAVLARLRRLFDLTADPAVIAAHLGQDPALAPLVRDHPGRRVPGAFDGFECAWRAVLGQQVSVRAATTLAGRVAEAFGESIETPFEGLTRLTPTASRLARTTPQRLERLGIIGGRAETIRALARAVDREPGLLDLGADVEAAMARWQALPGVGPWTASYIAMRALRWPDAFPESDLALRKALGDPPPREVRQRAERWRPWRAYAVMHLWANGSMGVSA